LLGFKTNVRQRKLKNPIIDFTSEFTIGVTTIYLH